MKRKVTYFVMLLVAVAGLAACNDSNEDNGATEEPNNETETATESNNEESNDEVIEEEEDEDNNSDESEGDSDLEIRMEDQEGLGIGDTGTFETALGTFELTLDSAEIINEIDGQQSQLDELLLLNLTIKNIDEKTLVAEEIMHSMEATDYLDGSGSTDYSSTFASVEELKGEIGPGEEMSGQFIANVYTSDMYYFRKDTGDIAAGYSNQVIWEIPAEEAKQQ